MKNHLSLPLDNYIENAKYMGWDKFLPVVMDAGRNDEGQQIIPLCCFFEAVYPHSPPSTATLGIPTRPLI